MFPSSFQRKRIEIPAHLVEAARHNAENLYNGISTAGKLSLTAAIEVTESKEASKGAVIFAIGIQVLALLYFILSTAASHAAEQISSVDYHTGATNPFTHLFDISHKRQPPTLVWALLILLAFLWNWSHWYAFGSSPGYLTAASTDTSTITIGNESQRQGKGGNGSGQTKNGPPDDFGRFDENGAELRWCKSCKVWQPLRAKHCSQCNKCVRKYDHHCFWVGTCVGEHNHFRFLLAVWAGMMYLSFGFVFMWHYFVFWREVSYHQPKKCLLLSSSSPMASLISKSEWPPQCIPPWASDHPTLLNVAANAVPVIVTIVTFVLALFCIILFGFHAMLCLSNQTTWEVSSASKITYLRKAPRSEPFSAFGALVAQNQHPVLVPLPTAASAESTVQKSEGKSRPSGAARQSVPLVDPSFQSLSPQLALVWSLECCKAVGSCYRELRPSTNGGAPMKRGPRSLVSSAFLGFSHNVSVFLWAAAYGGKDRLAAFLLSLITGVPHIMVPAEGIAIELDSRRFGFLAALIARLTSVLRSFASILCVRSRLAEVSLRVVRSFTSNSLRLLSCFCCLVSESHWSEFVTFYLPHGSSTRGGEDEGECKGGTVFVEMEELDEADVPTYGEGAQMRATSAGGPVLRREEGQALDKVRLVVPTSMYFPPQAEALPWSVGDDGQLRWILR